MNKRPSNRYVVLWDDNGKWRYWDVHILGSNWWYGVKTKAIKMAKLYFRNGFTTAVLNTSTGEIVYTSEGK